VARCEPRLTEALHELTSRNVPFFIGHPYWCGQGVVELLPLAGVALGVEVFNVTCTRVGRGLSESQWDELLAWCFHMAAIAVDDTHIESDIQQGWTVVKASAPDSSSIMAALVAGEFYASTGPSIHDFSFDADTLRIACDPVAGIQFVATASSGHHVEAASGEAITEGEWCLPSGFTGYIRAECRRDAEHVAWTNPVFFKDGAPTG